jgi:hypothetical protein
VASAIGRARKRGDRGKVRELRKQQRLLPSLDLQDPGYRRLRYVRYADDHLLGFTGPKAEAEKIKARLARFLREDLKLELSQEKTLITHATTEAAKFLGYEITVQHSNQKITKGRRAVNGSVRLRVPRPVIKAKCALYQRRGKPAPRTPLVNSSDLDIVATYGAEYRGIVQYYLLASDVYRLNRLNGVMRTSLLKTLACKHKSTGRKMAAKYEAKVETPHGLRTCLQVTIERGEGRKPLVARFGGIPLKRQEKAVIVDRIPERVTYPRKELPLRLLRGECEVCGRAADVTVHQIRKITDLGKPGPGQPEWARLMAKRRRKTLVACAECHHAIHAEHIAALLTA